MAHIPTLSSRQLRCQPTSTPHAVFGRDHAPLAVTQPHLPSSACRETIPVYRVTLAHRQHPQRPATIRLHADRMITLAATDLSSYLPILILVGMAATFGVFNVVASNLLGPSRTSRSKKKTYESGMDTIGSAHKRLNVRLIIAMVFLVFDIEIIFLYRGPSPSPTSISSPTPCSGSAGSSSSSSTVVAYVYGVRRASSDSTTGDRPPHIATARARSYPQAWLSRGTRSHPPTAPRRDPRRRDLAVPTIGSLTQTPPAWARTSNSASSCGWIISADTAPPAA